MCCQVDADAGTRPSADATPMFMLSDDCNLPKRGYSANKGAPKRKRDLYSGPGGLYSTVALAKHGLAGFLIRGFLINAQQPADRAASVSYPGGFLLSGGCCRGRRVRVCRFNQAPPRNQVAPRVRAKCPLLP